MKEILTKEADTATQAKLEELLARGQREKQLPSQNVETPTESQLKEAVASRTEIVCLDEMDDYDKAVEIPIKPRKSPIPPYKQVAKMEINERLFFAWVDEDEDGNRKIKITQQYKNGDFSPLLTILQGDVMLTAFAEVSTDEVLVKRVKKILLKLGGMYADRFRGARSDIVAVQDICSLLADNISVIPVYPDDIFEFERVVFYQKIILDVKSLSSDVLNDHKEYYVLTSDDLGYVAKRLGFNQLELLRKLKKYNFLYLQPSSKGYQTYVRLNGTGKDSFTTWRYCIIRDDELANNDEYMDIKDL